MREGEKIRSFVAVDVSDEVRAALQDVQRELARSRADVGWVRPNGLHVTLKFLGPVRRAQLEEVHAQLVSCLSGHACLDLHVRGLGVFPSLKRPRVLWAGVQADGLAQLARDVETALTRLGFDPEKRGFTPHITLGRVRSTRGWAPLEEHVKAHLGDDFGRCESAAVVVYRSTLRPDGAVYDALWTIPLRRNREGTTYG